MTPIDTSTGGVRFFLSSLSPIFYEGGWSFPDFSIFHIHLLKKKKKKLTEEFNKPYK